MHRIQDKKFARRASCKSMKRKGMDVSKFMQIGANRLGMGQQTGLAGMCSIIHDSYYHTSTLPVKINLTRIWK